MRLKLVAPATPDRPEVTITGRDIPFNQIKAEDLAQVIPTEQLLERLLGLRFHILSEQAETFTK